MPYSSDIFDETIKAHLASWKYRRYLDVGCGAGKYGRMIRDLFPDSDITGLEVDSGYVSNFHLHDMYDTVINASIESVLSGPQAVIYDVVLLGDVIEHLRKSDGIDIIHFFIYRCKRIIVVYPSKYIQYDTDGRHHESHRSAWAAHDFCHFACDHMTREHMNLAIIRGYIDDKDAVYPTMAQQ